MKRTYKNQCTSLPDLTENSPSGGGAIKFVEKYKYQFFNFPGVLHFSAAGVFY